MVAVGRVVSLLTSLTFFHFSLAAGHNIKLKGIEKAYLQQRRRNHGYAKGSSSTVSLHSESSCKEREPVSFVCTNKANYEGDTQTPSVTTGQTRPATTGPSSPKEGSTKLYTSSDRTDGQSTSSNSFAESYSPSDGVSESTQSRRSTAPPTSFEASKEITEKFILTFLAIKCTDPTTEIFIGTKSCDVGASGNISFPLKNVPNVTFSLNPGSGETFVVNSTVVPSESELNQKVNSAVVIISDEEVVVYGHQRCHGGNNYRATAFGVKEIEDLGTEYWVITHQSKGTSQVGVVATRNDTNISINGVYVNKTLNLNKYETFYFGGPHDLTGTYIVADKPILVIAGNSADISPNSNIPDGIDSFNKCLPPVEDWGKHFTLVPFPASTQPFTAKILSSHDNCTLEYVIGTGSRMSVSLGKGEAKILNSLNVLNINSSEGILVAQFLKDEHGYGNRGNPSMLLTPPNGNAGRNEFIFPVFRLSEDNGDETYYITILLPPTSNISLDNKTVSWNEIGEGTNANRIVQTTLSSPGFHRIHSSKNITAVVSGVGFYRYYSYFLH